jgi:hypothetical protein
MLEWIHDFAIETNCRYLICKKSTQMDFSYQEGGFQVLEQASWLW